MTFNVPLRDSQIFASDKNKPKIHRLKGTITPRAVTAHEMNIEVKDEKGSTFKGILKHDRYDRWEGYVGNYFDNNIAHIILKYQHALKRGNVEVRHLKSRINPHIGETTSVGDHGYALLHIEGANNQYIVPKDPKKIYFRQNKKNGCAEIKGSLTNIQNNALRKVQFSADGENFKGEMSMPMMDIDLHAPMIVGNGYATGDKGSLADIHYIEQGNKRKIRAYIKSNKYEFRDNYYKKRGKKLQKTKLYTATKDMT